MHDNNRSSISSLISTRPRQDLADARLVHATESRQAGLSDACLRHHVSRHASRALLRLGRHRHRRSVLVQAALMYAGGRRRVLLQKRRSARRSAGQLATAVRTGPAEAPLHAVAAPGALEAADPRLPRVRAEVGVAALTGRLHRQHGHSMTGPYASSPRSADAESLSSARPDLLHVDPVDRGVRWPHRGPDDHRLDRGCRPF